MWLQQVRQLPNNTRPPVYVQCLYYSNNTSNNQMELLLLPKRYNGSMRFVLVNTPHYPVTPQYVYSPL